MKATRLSFSIPHSAFRIAVGQSAIGPLPHGRGTDDNKDIRSLTGRGTDRRRGSVLVLVMTLLGVLFVLGVAFLATMNFEADLIAADARRDETKRSLSSVTSGLGSMLRDNLFDMPSAASSESFVPSLSSSYAELPGWHNTFSPVEPYRDPGSDGILFTPDDRVTYRWYADPHAGQRPHMGPTWPDNLKGYSLIDVLTPSGTEIPGEPVFVDADGDGISDALRVEARDLGISEDALASLSTQVSPRSKPGGMVYAGLRIVPHGGMVNLNASHPKLIDTVFAGTCGANPCDVIKADGTAKYNYFLHRPSQPPLPGPANKYLWPEHYSSMIEEPLLRRRGLLPPRAFTPSVLHGNPFSTDPDAINTGTYEGDMAFQLFWPAAQGYDNVIENQHRYQPFSPCTGDPKFPGDCYEPNVDLWSVLNEPYTSVKAKGNLSAYDRRHLVTTISYDDLLSRGGHWKDSSQPGYVQDVFEKMAEANRANFDPGSCPEVLAFEYLDYPDTLPTQSNCCPTDGNCQTNPRKGKLQLSLPFLDERIAAVNDMISKGKTAEGNSLLARIQRVIHDSFFLLVRNAVGPEWETRQPCKPYDPNAPACPPGTVCVLTKTSSTEGRCSSSAPYFDDVNCTNDAECDADETCNTEFTPGLCVDRWTGQRRSQARLTRTAAALTANLLDFADADDFPTRIALRTFDFNRGMCEKGSGVEAGHPCASKSDCAGGTCTPAAGSAGREIDFDEATQKQKPIYVYGLEHQPYVTGVATKTKDDETVEGWAVELFNPYLTAIDATAAGVSYTLQVYNSAGSPGPKYKLNHVLEPNAPGKKPFLVLSNNIPNGAFNLRATGSVPPVSMGLSFNNGSTIYLVREHDFDGPGGEPPTPNVVDQFDIPQSSQVGANGTLPDTTFSTFRAVRQDSPWLCTVPVLSGDSPDQTLGSWRNGPLNVYPVEVNFADTGRLGMPYPSSVLPPPAFPTTGSMLLIMRHANRSLEDMSAATIQGLPAGKARKLAFTTRLDEQTPYTMAIKNAMGNVEQLTPTPPLPSSQEIDNGRMPIFDTGEPDQNFREMYHAHLMAPYLTPAWDPSAWKGYDPTTWPKIGDLNALPWGQLVFDYFTALPLSSLGPYPVCPAGMPVADCTKLRPKAESQPRVDQDGLRVHGRINVNAAPWTVLQGLPLIPMTKIPLAFRPQIAAAIGIPDDSPEAGTVGFALAQAMVAYREIGAIGDTGNDTGDYNDGTPFGGPPSPPDPTKWYGRGWNLEADPKATPPKSSPAARRGTGFMSIGELANVRHLGAKDNSYRIDGGLVNAQTDTNNFENFVAAAAKLIALGDWVSVRSHVFTVYGLLQGERDETIVNSNPSVQEHQRIADVHSRAIRFQETIDRLPTLTGKALPTRIGERTTVRYSDLDED